MTGDDVESSLAAVGQRYLGAIPTGPCRSRRNCRSERVGGGREAELVGCGDDATTRRSLDLGLGSGRAFQSGAASLKAAAILLPTTTMMWAPPVSPTCAGTGAAAVRAVNGALVSAAAIRSASA